MYLKNCFTTISLLTPLFQTGAAVAQHGGDGRERPGADASQLPARPRHAAEVAHAVVQAGGAVEHVPLHRPGDAGERAPGRPGVPDRLDRQN